MKEQDVKEKFIELRAKGLSFDKIAQKLKVSKQSLISWSKEFQTVIANLKAIELEALYDKYSLSKEGRISLFGEKLKAIKEELDKRDLSEIPTDKLFDLLIKYSNILKDETIETIFEETRDELDLLSSSFVKKISWKG